MKRLHDYYLRLSEHGPDSFADRVALTGLWLLSCPYGLAVRLRHLAYESGLKKVYRASVPIVSVGNLAAGGTGKTPMVDYLAKWMASQGVPTAIISRGYGGSYSSRYLKVVASGAAATNPAACGDEPFLLARRNPATAVFVARRRADGVRAAERDGARLIILDDGFQHRAVHRDLDIVLLDGRNPFGNGYLLPAGQLREPRSALQRCHLVVTTRTPAGCGTAPTLSKPVIKSRHVMAEKLVSLTGTEVSWQDLAGKSCVAFAGIARTADFFAELEMRGLVLVDQIPLVDHQVYDAGVLERLVQVSQSCDAMITTEKDAVKLGGVEFMSPCYQVGVDLAFSDESLLEGSLRELAAKSRSLTIDNRDGR